MGSRILNPIRMLLLKIKQALRGLWRSGIFTYVNLLGLAVSIGAVMVIFVYVHAELNTDGQFKQGEDLYRIIRKVEGPNSSYQSPSLSGPFREYIRYEMNLPGKDILRIFQDDELVSYKQTTFFEPNFLYTDSNFFQLLDFPLQSGHSENALKEVNSAVISSKIAKKYFGDRDPIGEILEVDGKGLLEVTGVLAKAQSKSHLDLDFVVNLGSLGYTSRILKNAEAHSMTYYLHIPPKRREASHSQLASLAEKHLNPAISPTKTSLSLQPLAEIYFGKPMESEIARHGNRSLIQSLIAIALILSLLAASNFINLTIAKLTKGLRQIGVKKILGSSRKALIFDWAIEVYVIVLLATLLGAVLCNLILPTLVSFYELHIILPNPLHILAYGLGFTLLLTALIIVIPGSVFSSISSYRALSNKLGSIKTHILQYSLLLFQFVVAFVLIVFTIVINRQYQYMQEKDMGLEDEQILIFNSNNKHSWKNKDHIKTAVSQLSGVKEVSMAYGGLPISPNEVSSYQMDQSTYQWNTAFIQPNLLNLLQVKVLEGTTFDEDIDSEIEKSVVLNEAAAKQLGWPQQNLIGKSLRLPEEDSSKQILGIVKDYHYESFKSKIEPLVLRSSNWEESFIVKLAGNSDPALLADIEGIWNRYVPKYPFSYQFLDATYQHMHQEDTKQGKIIFFFTLLTIIIASIGTLSLCAFIQGLKVKEVAIKKILGASMARIFYALGSGLLKVLLIAGLISIPLAWFFANNWLNDFSYRISLSLGIFLIGFISLMGLILILIVVQSWRIATLNPIDSLKAE